MSGSINPQGFPFHNMPVVDPRTGMLSQPWLQFFVSLWNRTGSAEGSNINEFQVSSTVYDGEDQPDLFPETLLNGIVLSDDEGSVDLDQVSLKSEAMAGDESHLLLDEVALQSFSMVAESDDASLDEANLKALAMILEDGSETVQFANHPGYVPGRFYSIWDGNVGATGAIGAVDTIYLYPFFIAEDVQISSLFLRVVTAGAGSSAKAGIWSNRNGKPTGTPIVVDNAGVSTATTGMKAFSITATTLRRGWYWVGVKFTGTLPVCTNIVGTSALMSSRVGGSSDANSVNNGATNQISGQSFTDAYANNMPDLTSSSLTDVSIASAGIPVFGFGVP